MGLNISKGVLIYQAFPEIFVQIFLKYLFWGSILGGGGGVQFCHDRPRVQGLQR